jgi:hypothetical protein
MDLASIFSKGVNAVFFLSVIGFVVFLVLLVVHNYVTPILPFLPSDKEVILPDSTVVNAQLRIKNSESRPKPELPDSKLDFDKIQIFKYENFTISFDVFLNGLYISTDVPRVLMYFDTAPVNIVSNSVTENDLTTLFGNTNFLVFCDSVKNDLIVAAITLDGSSRSRTRGKLLEKAAVIQNIPINTPFKLTITITPNFFEVYMNKELVKTYKLKNTLATATPSSRNASIISPISFIQDTIQIANVEYFDTPLRSDQVRYTTSNLKDKSYFT